MKPFRWLTFAVFVLGFAAESKAALLTWDAVLNAAQENNSANTSTATGFGTVTFDTATNVLTLDLSWSGLTGPGAQAHIHCCIPPTGSASIALDLWLAIDPRPATGTYHASYDLDLVDPFRVTFQTGLTALDKFAVLQAAMDEPRHAYYNIHTAQFPGGEIRGNLAPAQVPEPATLLLLALGAGALRWRRARP